MFWIIAQRLAIALAGFGEQALRVQRYPQIVQRGGMIGVYAHGLAKTGNRRCYLALAVKSITEIVMRLADDWDRFAMLADTDQSRP